MNSGLWLQLEVVHGLLLREAKTRFGEHQLGYAWALVAPLMWVATFSVISYVTGRLAPPGTSVVPFFVTGVVPFTMFRNTSQQAMSAISGNQGLLTYAQVRPLDLVLSRVVLEVATQILVFFVIMAGIALIEQRAQVGSILEVLMGLFLTAGMGAGVGLVLCGLSTLSPTVERIHGPLFRPLMWLSAVFHPIDSVPTQARDALLMNPLVHSIELVREGWFPGYHSRHVNGWYPLLWIVLLMFFGLSLERVARRQMEHS